MCRDDLMDAFLSFLHQATEEELDEALRSVGEDPEEVLRRANGAIERALAHARGDEEAPK